MPKRDNLISVIIAVYNIEECVVECLNSVAQQSYKNLDIVIVDDGSTDGSLKLCREFKKKHKDRKIRVIHTKNYGLSHARNRGIKSARGKYICFVDGDDYLEPEYVKNLYTAIKTEDAEVAVGGYRPVRDLFMTEKFVRSSQLPIRETVTGEYATIRFLIGQQNVDVVAWNKMFLKSLFTKHKIKFPEGEIFEDKLTIYKLYYAAKNVTFIDDIIYNYRQRKGSIMNKADMKKRLAGRLNAAREAEKYLKKKAGRYEDVTTAAYISIVLSHFAFLDNAMLKRVSWSNFTKHRAWILKNEEKIRENIFITKKLRYYLLMLGPFNGAMYKFFRKIRHE